MTTTLRTGTEDLKQDLIEQVADRVRERLDKTRAPLAERFVRQYYEHVPPDDLVAAGPDELYGAAMSMWAFAQERAPGQRCVHVYNARVDDSGWSSHHTIVEIVIDDTPFLVDSIVAELGRLDATVHLVIHPIIVVSRDENGHLTNLRATDEPEQPDDVLESCMHVEITEQSDAACAEIQACLEEVLDEARLAVDDWEEMRARCRDAIEALRTGDGNADQAEIDEAIAFLDWADDNNFIYLGYREYDFRGDGADTSTEVREERGLGILRDPATTVFGGLRNLGSLPAHVLARIRSPDLLRITKANRRSRVHRPVFMDTIAVKSLDATGKDRSERLFVGLFTSEAYSHNPRSIPLLRRKVDDVLAHANFSPRSHDYRVLRHVVETYPRDDLFQISIEELRNTALGILHLQERGRTALFVRVDPFERFVSCIVYVPRERFDTTVRLRFQTILEESFQGRLRDFYTLMNDQPLARLRYVISCRPGDLPDIDIGAIEYRLQEAARSWADRLNEALIEARGEEQGTLAYRRFGDAFPSAYWEQFNEQTAVADIAHVETATLNDTIEINLYRSLESEPYELQLKIYARGKPTPLTDVVPMIENMGLRVNAERPYELRPSDEARVSIRDFQLETNSHADIDLIQVKDVFQDAFTRVWRGDLENDGFNHLVLAAGLTAREVTIIRAYAKYLRQAQIPFSQEYMEQTLADHPEFARLLVDLFQTRFDPDSQEGAETRGERITLLIEARLEDVSNLDDDRIIRRFLNLINVTLRTNYYQKGADGRFKRYLSLKLDSQQVDELPLPRPFREIWVYSPETEAIHLRGGQVARGGIRWSDRREDFRTEILGLMKAQMVKNTVIVPVGSKGGFVAKPPRGGEVTKEFGVECYKTLMRGLLDITDNLTPDGVVPPERVVRYDGDDPYLVVAADKGTATFSDIANGISIDYGFWLDDAFASGGSVGYDHKVMGITAKGAWECVKRHFREMGKDIQSEPFTVIGIGDMSGDVFGNGMLLSRHIRLLGAFNHMHIFVDPDPDAATSFAERERMFHLERSTWEDYDVSKISAGGAVFDRKAKSIAVSPQMQAAFGIEADTLTPNELIGVLLRTQAELLWFGGIGTYVKASGESHLDAGDRANDALRVDAPELAVAVIGEGANLGMTQRARVQFGMLGGRLNTDAIDNSGGVDCSDHEVNIKILLGDVERAGEMTRVQRNEVLESMTDEVGDLSMRDNYLQSQAISVTHRMGVHLLDRLAHFIRALSKEGRLDPALEFLPDEETLAERFQKGLGLTRPSLAVLLAYAKMELYEELLASDLPDDPYTDIDLQRYFPAPLRENYAAAISRHQLRREIICTVITNEIINRVGIAFLHEVRGKTGASAADVARAFVIARAILGMRNLWRDIESLDNQAPAVIQSSMLVECGRLMERATVWFLREAEQPLRIEAELEAQAGGVGEFAKVIDDLLEGDDRTTLDMRIDTLVEEGCPEPLARRVGRLAFVTPAFDVVRLARDNDLTVADAAALYFAVGARFGMTWLRRAASRLPSDTAWDKRAVSAIVDDLFAHQSAVTRQVIETSPAESDPGAKIEIWAAENPRVVVRTEQLLAELQGIGTPKFSMLAVANRELKALYG